MHVMLLMMFNNFNNLEHKTCIKKVSHDFDVMQDNKQSLFLNSRKL